MNDITIHSSVTYLKGVGEKKSEILREELNIATIEDLLNYFPYRYIDKSKYYKIKDLPYNINTYVQVKGRISEKSILGENRGKRLVAKFYDETGSIMLVWFNNIKYFSDMLKTNETYIIFGKPTQFNQTINITHPEISTEEKNTFNNVPFLPMYNSTDKCKKYGLDSRGIYKLCHTAIETYYKQIEETIPQYIREKLHLIDKQSAMRKIHLPQTASDIEQSIRRLKYEEVFLMQLLLLQSHQSVKVSHHGHILPKVGTLFNTFYKQYLPFPLTNAQKRVIKEIRADFLSGKQMNRLLQGDVGSGKTITALLLMLLVIDNGYQCCLMAPTEILAQQHYQNICKLLKNMPIEIGLLTGSTKQKERTALLKKAEEGSIKIFIGTHALYEDQVLFKNLAFVVIDEQHRFGVEQRAKLWRKNLTPPHVLVMTATPIPRTLAMTVYGDLDISVIDELPVGRKPIKTLHFYKQDSEKINHFLKQEIQQGRQVYVVFPLIQESETLTLSNLMDGYEMFKKYYPDPTYKVGCVHGKMSGEEKEAEMNKFKQGETHILLATTVIEVGIDVPNATVMVIENAERFGLSQLHQLRGRVGRGSDQSYCVLISDFSLSKEARIRIQAMLNTNDGFELANVDLKLRGPGDITGTRQSGMLNFKLLNIAEDELLISSARNMAQCIINDDPELQKEQNKELQTAIEKIKLTNKYYQIG